MRPRLKAQTPVLDALPAYLRKDEAPDDEPAYRRWSQARRYWCRDAGYSVLDLIRAERCRPLPSKSKSVRDDQERP